MALLSVQTALVTGIVPTYNAVSASDTFSNDGGTRLHIKNGGGGTCTVTITTPYTLGGLALADQVISIGAGVENQVAVLSTQIYNASDDLVTITFSPTTSVTMSLIKG